MFKTVYKRSHLIASGILALCLMSTAGAVALGERRIAVPPAPTFAPAPAADAVPLIGHFTVTPQRMTFAPAR